MSDQFLDFDINGEIIATIKRHKANTATMAREIIQIRAEYTDLANMYEADTNKLRAELAQAREALRWIPVSERMPEEGQEIIAFTPYCTYKKWDGCIRTHCRNGEIYDPFMVVYTHWMPLPEPPEEK